MKFVKMCLDTYPGPSWEELEKSLDKEFDDE